MIKACYSDRYYAPTKSRSMEKLSAVAHALDAQELAELVDPDIMDIDLLYQLHHPALVDAFLVGQRPLATSQGFQWDKQVRDAVLSIQAGQLCGAALAFKDGIAANIAQGFHHATYEFGSGYCTFNGLALIAQQHPDKRIVVLDCDQHGGNGTAEFTERLPNLYNFTIFGLRFGCREFDRSVSRHIHIKDGSFSQYQAALHEAFAQILHWQPDLLIYQAGMDVHQADPYGSAWCDSAALMQRDQMVFEFTHQHQIPVLFVLAGGYQALDQLVGLHVNTFRVAQKVYFPECHSTRVLAQGSV